MSATIASQAAPPALLCTFQVRDALCALDATRVQEVIRLSRLTPVHHAPPEVAGIVNLRGKIVTVIDLGYTLGFSRSLPGTDSRVFILEDRNEFFGLLVDRVGEVVEVEPGQCQPPPANVPPRQARLFQAVCRANGQVVAILRADAILADSEAGAAVQRT